jgi:hypothetical protein
VSIYTMTAPVATRLRGTSTSIYPSVGHWPVDVPQLVTGTRAGSMCQPAAGIQADPTFIPNRVVEVAKQGSPPRGAPS